MAFDIEMIKKVYSNIVKNVDDVRSIVNKPLSLSREELLKERAVELYMEGHRFFDLTRFGVYDEYCRFIYGDTDGARQPEDYTWPIPLTEASTNSEID